MSETRVVNRRREAFDVDIGRPGKWGNPFVVGKDGTRREVIQKYRRWIVHEGSYLLKDVQELIGKRLGCYCKPAPCHGDVLVELISKIEEVAE